MSSARQGTQARGLGRSRRPPAARRRRATTAGKRSLGSSGTRTESCDCDPARRARPGPRSRSRSARSASRSIGVTARRPPRNDTARAPAWPSLMRACWSAMQVRAAAAGTGPKRSSSSSRSTREVGDLARAGDAAVHVDLRLLVGDVVGRDVGVDVDVEAHRLGARRRRRRPPAACDGLVEHLHVELEAERRDVAGLLVAEQVAGAADLEVAHGDLEAGAELGVVAERAQALRRLLGQRGVRGVQQVGVGALAGAADAPADLVELGRGRRRRRARRSACWPAGCRCPTR